MKHRLAIVLALIVVLPTALLIGFGVRLARHEQERTRERFEDLLQERLGDVDSGIARLLRERENLLLRVLSLPEPTPLELRGVARAAAGVEQAFALDPAGRLIYPNPGDTLKAAEWDFLERAQDILLQGDLLRQAAGAENPAAGQTAADHGWLTWYWGRDIRLLFWIRDAQGRIVGAELDRIALLADIIAALPDTQPLSQTGADGALEGRIRLLDARGEVLYQWGPHEPAADASATVRRALSAPLDAWSLDYFLPGGLLANSGRGTLMAVLAGTVALGLILAGLAVYFYRESSRELRVAAQRVTFVNQVSHELKTPLTNIRLYAELLADRLDDADETAGKHLNVIVSESQRLSRLIGNILSFGRQQRDKLTLHRTPGEIDAAVRSILEHYRPGLEAAGIAIAFAPHADGTVLFDADLLEQVLGNLLSNVEKYAAAGGSLQVESRLENGTTRIVVRDAGPGIPPAQAERVFLPFHRISNHLTEGISGTGIGLAIARDLARLHGGDLRLLSSQTGSAFELSLATPDADGSESP